MYSALHHKCQSDEDAIKTNHVIHHSRDNFMHIKMKKNFF